MNRLDKIMVFRALSKQNISKIVNVQLADLSKRLLNRKLGLKTSAPLRRWLAEEGYDPKNGVRPLRRLIQDEIEDRIAESLLSGDISEGDVVNVALSKGQVVVSSLNE